MPPESSFTSDSDLESVFSIKDFVANSRRNSISGPKYFCSFGCNEAFKRMDELDRHEYHHTGIKKHACKYQNCDKTYTILTHLKRHLRTTHERTEPPAKNVPCLLDGCDKMFQSESNMQRHIREVHENPKVYNCSFCGEKFTQKLKMRRHEISQHTKQYPFNCEKCSKGFYQEWQLKKHIPACKVYICPDCNTQFDKWSNYIKHCKDMQHGRKYYKCEYCPRVYSKCGELQRHTTVWHMETELALNFKCTHEGCGRAYAYERNMKQHIRTAHGGKRFQCLQKYCKRDFTSAQNLDKHVKREHELRKRTRSNCSDAEINKTNDDIMNKPPRKKRKDAGKSKVSSLAALTGLIVDRDLDNLLRQRDANTLKVIGAHLQELKAHESNVSDEEQCSIFKTKECTKDLNKKQNEDTEVENLLNIVLDDN